MKSVLDVAMNRASFNDDSQSHRDNDTESDHESPQSKRRCQSLDSPRNLAACAAPPVDEPQTKEICQSCTKQEALLKTFRCPSLHHFCLNCIFNWTQKHLQTKTPPACSVANCGYLLKNEDLHDLPITVKDYQTLLDLVNLKIDDNNNSTTTSKTAASRLKCGKCDLYIDQHNFYIHGNECQGRLLTIPCEVCFCPVLISDYEQHMLICTNENNAALVEFLLKHLKDPKTDEKIVKSFIQTWDREHRHAMDIYEMIEEFDRMKYVSERSCEVCRKRSPVHELCFINCFENHSQCLDCYKQHVERQMNSNQILTCHQCDYHLQDRDLSETRAFDNDQITALKDYQNTQVTQSYHDLYGNEDATDPAPADRARTQSRSATSTDNGPRRQCELCSKHHSYDDFFLLSCNCKICYDCFAAEMDRQRITSSEILVCSFCRSPIKHNDLSNLRTSPAHIRAIQTYQQDKLFESEHAPHLVDRRTNQVTTQATHDNRNDDDAWEISLLSQQQNLPKYWASPMLSNFSRHALDPQSTEYEFVQKKFFESWPTAREQVPASVPPPLPPIPQGIGIRPPRVPPIGSLGLPTPPQPPASLRWPAQSNSQSFHTPSLAGQRAMAQPPHSYPTAIFNNPRPMNNNQVNVGQTLPYGGPILVPPGAQFQLNYHAQNTNPASHASLQQRIRAARRPRAGFDLDTDASAPKIIQIERIQNQRWFKQYSAHECEFRQKLGRHTQRWLFHGCDEQASKNIELECFNRSYAGLHATAHGQGCYFATDSRYSHDFAKPDHSGIRRIFLARVLVGRTIQGDPSMRVPPAGYDTTGNGGSIFVTYHDSQAYAEYLISYQ